MKITDVLILSTVTKCGTVQPAGSDVRLCYLANFNVGILSIISHSGVCVV